MTFKILSAEIAHETNTFNIVPTTLQSFKERYLLNGEQAIAARGDNNTELAGLLDTGRDYAWNINHVISAAAGPGGVVTRDAFDAITAPLFAAAQGNYDGIFLMLHGAMVIEDCDDAEGEIVRRLRRIAPALPIAVTLDYHTNLSRVLVEHATVITGYKTYPHVDMYEAGMHAGGILVGALDGDDDELHMSFNFQPLYAGFDAEAWRGPIERIERELISRHSKPRLSNASKMGIQ